MQELIFFFDDSGTLHKNSNSDYFVYAGYVFVGRDNLNIARRKYINSVKKLKKTLNRTDELKASSLSRKHKRMLFKSVEKFLSLSITTEITRLYDYLLEDKKSICRYKDYALKRGVKYATEKLIADGLITTNEDITLTISIDEQLTATNGYYDLRDSIREELQHGIVNFNYGIIYQPLFDSKVSVNITYCDSKTNYMIQASDILANRIWSSYVTENTSLRAIKNHIDLTLP